MSDLEYRADKFVFKVRQGLLYSSDEVWLKSEADTVRVGITDFAQRRGGDIVFAEVKPVSSHIEKGGRLGSYETVKLVQDILSPVEGTITASNQLLDTEPEVLNRDPYGEGWVAVIKPARELVGLLSAEDYFVQMKANVADELRKIKGV